MKKCEQYKCTFRTSIADCPECDECHARPHEINDTGNCVNCWCCAGDEGYIRSGKSARQVLASTIQLIKELEEMKNETH